MPHNIMRTLRVVIQLDHFKFASYRPDICMYICIYVCMYVCMYTTL